MKKILKVIVSVLCLSTLMTLGLPLRAHAQEDIQSVVLIVNGNLGDLGFFDSANEGMTRVNEELGLDIQVIETGSDVTTWEPALVDAAESDAQIIVAVSPSMVEPIERTAPMYPDKTFILIDNAVDYEREDFSNVYSARFKQNEGSFLAGALAALMINDLPNANPDAALGFIGGMDIPAINDFLVGYIEGALYINPEIKVSSTYVGDYYDPARGKELGLTLINSGVDVIFPAAGPSGLGVIEAAREQEKYIIGVDNDQAALYLANGDEATANIIISSMEKKVGDVLFNSVQSHVNGELELGTAVQLGIVDGAVGLAKNEIFLNSLSEETISQLEEIEELLVNGEIEVSTAIGMETNTLNELKDQVSP